jgi:hypothetical protein
MAKTLATQRSLKSLSDNGWMCHIVEKFLPARGNMKFPRRIDAYGFGDILACKPLGEFGQAANAQTTDVARLAMIALVQCCPGTSHAEHKAKILNEPKFLRWKAAGGLVKLHSWSKKGPRGKAKRWTLREEDL